MLSLTLNTLIVLLLAYIVYLIYSKVSTISMSKNEQREANIVIKEDHIDTGADSKDTVSKVIESIQWNCLDEEFILIKRMLEKYNIDCRHVCDKTNRTMDEVVEIYLPNQTERLK